MRTICVYQFNELSPKAQEKAIQEMTPKISEIRVNFDGEDYRNTLEKIEDILCINVYDWEVGGRGCPYYKYEFDSYLPYDVDDPKYLTRYFEYIWSNAFRHGKYIGWRESVHKAYYSKVLSNEESFSPMGMWTDDALVQVMKYRYEYVRSGYTIADFVTLILDNFFNQWQDDYDYSSEEECVREELENSEYEYLEDGTPY